LCWRSTLAESLTEFLAPGARLQVTFRKNVFGDFIPRYARKQLWLYAARLGVEFGAHVFGHIRPLDEWFHATRSHPTRGIGVLFREGPQRMCQRHHMERLARPVLTFAAQAGRYRGSA
jgi:hypothetical protein